MKNEAAYRRSILRRTNKAPIIDFSRYRDKVKFKRTHKVNKYKMTYWMAKHVTPWQPEVNRLVTEIYRTPLLLLLRQFDSRGRRHGVHSDNLNSSLHTWTVRIWCLVYKLLCRATACCSEMVNNSNYQEKNLFKIIHKAAMRDFRLTSRSGGKLRSSMLLRSEWW